MYFNFAVPKVQPTNYRIVVGTLCFSWRWYSLNKEGTKEWKRSSRDETLLDRQILFQSSVVMISYPNSTLKPIRDLRKYTLNSEVSTFPQRAFNDSILSAKIIGDIPRSFPRPSILDMPRHEKKNTYSTSICVPVLLLCITKEDFFDEGHWWDLYGRNSCLSHNTFIILAS